MAAVWEAVRPLSTSSPSQAWQAYQDDGLYTDRLYSEVEEAAASAMLCGDDYRDGIAPHTDW
ncbi:hypothetical protein GCM10022214_01670 [Actinomadura miaoliensis]|uniref:Uncharacterized protein n=1 Tax=Actinomadura miaoliensis TaxID=430685 RepID=A0ABP7UWG1_9ACTN